MACIILHGPLFGLGAECIGNPLRRALVICRERHPDMTIVEDRIRGAISLFDLIEGLRDQEGLEAIACHIGERAFEEVEAPKGRKLVQHEQDTPTGLYDRHRNLRRKQPANSENVRQKRSATREYRRTNLEMLRQPPAHLIEDEAHQGLRPRKVRGRDDEVERKRPVAGHQILDPEIAPRGDFGNHRVAIERQEPQRC